MKKVGRHNTDVARMVMDSEQRQRNTSMKVAVIEEEREDDTRVSGFDAGDESESIRVGGKKGQQRISDEPLESQKASIVKQLVGMNANIRNFSENMEARLE